MTNQLFGQRISPSGPLLGSPPALVGGGQIDARCWRAQGTDGNWINIPGNIPPVPSFGAWTPVPGLESVPVDFQAGYGYDFAVDVVAKGTGREREQGQAQAYGIWPLMSLDGVSWGPLGGRGVSCFDVRADGRFHYIYIPQYYPGWQFVRIVVMSAAALATADLTYLPTGVVLVIQEFTTA